MFEKTRGIMALIKIYDNGEIYLIDEKDIYDPFPDKKWQEADTDDHQQTDELA